MGVTADGASGVVLTTFRLLGANHPSGDDRSRGVAGPRKHGEPGPLFAPSLGLRLVDAARSEHGVGADDESEHVGEAVRRVDAPAVVVVDTDATARRTPLLGPGARELVVVNGIHDLSQSGPGPRADYLSGVAAFLDEVLG